MTDLQRRLDLLADAATLLARHGMVVDDVDGFVERARGRLRHGTDHTVAALVGSTGSGKSSILNAMAGAPVARAGVTRPTTAITQAVTFGDTADGLLDLLGITQRHHLGANDPALSGLVLLDLPDFDSVTVAHRLEVDRLVELVDLMVWVTDPQKYGDESLHVGYLQPLSTHGDVMQIVLNKVDTLDPAARQQCLADLRRLLVADGLPDLEPIAGSTIAGSDGNDGLDELRGVLAAEVNAKQAAIERISADIDDLAARMRAAAGERGTVDLDRLRGPLVDGLAAAAGVDAVAALVAAQHRRDATLATGWPPLRWVRRFRRAPLGRLRTTVDNTLAVAEVSRTLRSTATAAADSTAAGWGQAASSTVRGSQDAVVEALDTGISRQVQVLRQPPRWWRPVQALHRVLLAVAAVGGVWLLGLALAETFLLIDTDAFVLRWRGVALPSALLVGGLAAGFVVAVVAGLAARVGGRRQASRATAQLRDQVAGVADTHVLAPLDGLRDDAGRVGELLDGAATR